MDPDEEIFKAILRPGLNQSGVQHVHVLCRDRDMQDDFYESLLEQASETSGWFGVNTCLFLNDYPGNLLKMLLEAVGTSPIPQIRSIPDFLNAFRESIDSQNITERTITICLKHTESLRNIAKFPLLTQLFQGFNDEWLMKRLRIVTLAGVPWDLIVVSEEASPAVLHTVYKENAEVESKLFIEVMRLQIGALDLNADLVFCRGFSKFCTKCFEQKTTDPHTLLFLISKVAGQVKPHTDPTDEKFKKDVVKKFIERLPDDFVYLKVDFFSMNTTDPVEEIAYYARFVLVAAYCASYNRKTTDLRFFAREREGKRRIASKSKSENNFQETGPQVFTLNRLQGMVYFFMGDYLKYADPIPDIHSLINQLCAMKLISRMSTDSNLNKPKYRCEASYDFVVQVARSLDINLSTFLESDPSALTTAMPLIALDA